MDDDRKESGEETAEADSEDNLPSDSSNDPADASDNTDMADTSGANDISANSNSNRLSGISLNGHVTRGRPPHNYFRFSNVPGQPEWMGATDFGTSFSTASEMSLYQSALDLADMAKLDPRGSVNSENIPLSTNDVLEGIAEETTTTTPTMLSNMMISFSDDLYLRDGRRRIDYVLAYNTNESTSARFSEIRKAFEDNLLEDGVQLEYECEDEKRVQFVKLHAPWEVLTRYAEIMKLKMPMKVLSDSVLEELCVDELFPDLQQPDDKKLPSRMFPTEVPGKILRGFYRLFGYDEQLFPPSDKRFTYEYAREKEYLFDIPKNRDDFFTPSQRGQVMNFILKRTSFSLGKKNDFSTGIIKLLAEKVYSAAYPLHEGRLDEPMGISNPRKLLSSEWATLRKIHRLQPLDHIRNYLGVTFGLYFAWLGFYTYMLIPASIVGLLCFIYGLATMGSFIPSQDICEKGVNITMCPVCDTWCDYWSLSETCVHSRITYLFDNAATVIFAVFMSFWSALFLELWKRYSADITYRWDLSGFDQRELQPRPEYLARLAKKKKEKMIDMFNRDEEPRVSFWKWKFPAIVISFSVVILMITVAVSAVLAVIFYRMSVITALSLTDYGDAPRITSVTAAIINLICILILNQIYGRIAELLTELEMHRTQPEYDDSLTLKMFLLQFINYYASIFYIAFFKGRFVGHPGDYNRVFGSYRQEECGPGGCLMELSIQLSIIMIGKQTMNTFLEIGMPKIMQMYNMVKNKIGKTKSYVPQTSWERDYTLVPWQSQGLFWEYLEMVLQFGFVTIFVAAFPLAPLFALLNNCFEMRLDAKKILTYYRRPPAQRVKNIGIWFRILDGIGKLSVISNAFIIAFTSNLVPRLVYLYTVSEDGTLDGFVEHSLSYFRVSDYPKEYRRNATDFDLDVCRYEDYRKPPDSKSKYLYTHYHWHVMAARLAFIVVFENVVVLTVTLIRWLIPDVPHKLKERMRQEAYIVNEIIVNQEFVRARGELLRTNPRLIRFAQCDDPRSNHVSRSNANSIRRRPANNESVV